jgi:F0F1-type ATP synthase assembly protein I
VPAPGSCYSPGAPKAPTCPDNLSGTVRRRPVFALVRTAFERELVFGYLTDRFGRKKLFMITLVLYLVATVATAFSRNAPYFHACQFFTGAGIGGEYAAINSAVDELIPARLLGRVDLIINSSFWLGTMFGAALSLLLDKNLFAPNLGWRLAFGLGAILGLGILLVRRNVPESPRWLFIHGHNEQAEELVDDVERRVEEETGQRLEEVTDPIRISQRRSIGFGRIAYTAFKLYPKAHRARADPARPAVRRCRPAPHDHHVPRGVGGAAGRHRPAVQRRDAVGRHADRLLGGGILLRLGRGQRRLPDRQRDLPHGGQGHGPGLLLRRRHRHRRGHRPGPVRQAGRDRQGGPRLLRLPARRGADDRGRVAEWLIGVEAAGKSLEDVASR